jgi:DNA-binding transcriptional LysR family regulator
MLRISRLRQVLAIHEEGSFAKAAERLGVAQSSLSKSIARLEDELEIKLVSRSSSGSRLTPGGELLAERGRRLLEESESLRKDLMLIAGARPSQIRIGVASALHNGFLPRFAVAAVESVPGARLHFEVVPSHRLMQLLDKRELDLVFAGHPPEERNAELDTEHVFTTVSVVVAAPRHPLAQANRVTLDDLREYASCGLLHGHAKALGISEPEGRQFYQSNCFDAVVPIVCAGHAVLIVPSFVVRQQLEAGTLVALRCDWAVDVAYSAMTNRGVIETSAIQALIGAARTCAVDL